MKNFKQPLCRFPENLTAVLKNSELVIQSDSSKKKQKSLTKKQLSPGKETQQLISYQIEEITKLKKDKLLLENQVAELENQLKKLSFLPAVLKEKEKLINRLKKDTKKIKRVKSKEHSCKLKSSNSLRGTPKIRSDSFVPEGNLTTRHQSTRTHISLPSNRNSQNDFFGMSLHDILIRTENVLCGWERQCGKRHIL